MGNPKLFVQASGARRPGGPKAKRMESRKGRASAARLGSVHDSLAANSGTPPAYKSVKPIR